jgi:predicted O-linked N-acetylglucosamine transferase (SPINDLY family)
MPARDPGAALRSASDLFQQGRLHDARRVLRRLLDKDPNATGALQLAGIVASELGTHDQAVRYLTRARDLSPSSAGAHLNLGKALQAAGRLDEAMAAFASALRLRPDSPDIHIACGGAATAAERYEEAARHYREAIRLAPASNDGYFNLAKVLSGARKHEEAIVAWQEVSRREPHLVEPLLRIAESRQALCDWPAADTQVEALETVLRGGRATNREMMPGAAFWSLIHSDDADLHLGSTAFEGDPASPIAALPARKVRAGGRLKLAYVSADFRNHAVAKLVTRLLASHDRSRFEIVGIGLSKDDGSVFSRAARQACDVFLDAHALKGFETIAQMMRDNEVDIAVDLMGHTAHSRWGAFARRSAPIQVSFLGYPGTTGIPNMDYLVVDPFIAGGSLRAVATEKLVVMPDCYQCNDSRRAPAGEPPSRAACGLPESGFVFASFNMQRKITPDVFAAWMRILQRVEGSVLWLYVGLDGPAGEAAKANLRREAVSRGVAPERLVFGGRLPDDQHMARLGLADLHLDTFPYTSHTTGSDALWAGCPILTRVGQSFASRVCGSLLTTIGVPELITASVNDYEALAVRLAHDKAMLAGLRARIAEGRAQSPLFDTQRFCRNLERAYTEMVERARAGLPPAEIDVRTLN